MRSRGPSTSNTGRTDHPATTTAAATINTPPSSLSSSQCTTNTTKRHKFPLPGKVKQKRPLAFRPALRRKTNNPSNHGSRNSGNYNSSGTNNTTSSVLPLVVAVILWYSLGVASISSSKVLLTPYDGIDIDDEYLDDAYETHAVFQHVGGLPPLFLTVQQLLLGSTFLRLAIEANFLGLTTRGLVSLDELYRSMHSGSSKQQLASIGNSSNPVPGYLVKTGVFFALGFLTTNMAFGAAAPTYVETLKAAEPISSAILAVLWGIEILSLGEILGLLGIVGGVLMSTTGTTHSVGTSDNAQSSLVVATSIVMASNLCFSLRGLYQKLFRKGAAKIQQQIAEEQAACDFDSEEPAARPLTATKPSSAPLDDLNLQFRMQQTGVILLVGPMFLLHGPSLLRHVMGMAGSLSTPNFVRVVRRYALWSIGNGLAFSSYNLASTYLLTRISVVHHAALNCTRRIFAIVCTGLLFRIPISLQSAIGIAISFVGFIFFTKAKSIKNRKNAKRNRKVKKQQEQRDVPSGDALAQAVTEAAAPIEASLPSRKPKQQLENGNDSHQSRLEPPSSSDFGTHRRITAKSRSQAVSASSSGNRLGQFPPPPPPLPPPPHPPSLSPSGRNRRSTAKFPAKMFLPSVIAIIGIAYQAPSCKAFSVACPLENRGISRSISLRPYLETPFDRGYHRRGELHMSNNQFDVSKPVFDLLSLRSVRGDAVIRYNSLNQSEPLRINLYAFMALILISAPSLVEATGYDPMNIPTTIGTVALAAGSGALFVRECSRRSRQLTRIEKELNTESLPIRLPTNPFSEVPFSKPVPMKALRGISTPPRIVAICGNKSKLSEALSSFAIYRKRLAQASVYVVAISTDGSSAKDWQVLDSSLYKTWMADSYQPQVWLDYFRALTKDENNESFDFRWFGLNSSGRSFGSGDGVIQIIQLMGQ